MRVGVRRASIVPPLFDEEQMLAVLAAMKKSVKMARD